MVSAEPPLIFMPADPPTCTTSLLSLVKPLMSPVFAAFLNASAISLDATRTTPVPAGFVLVLINGAVAEANKQLVPELFLHARFPLPESP